MTTSAAPIIYLTAAEASGDSHAANLIHALRAKVPAARFAGVGGPRMAAAGCELLEDVIGNATMIFDSFHKVPYYYGVLQRIDRHIAQLRPSVLVPVDSPSLNWHTAAAARRHGVPVMYYVAPQVWAWAPWRVHKLRRRTDHVACLLPFEQSYFRSRRVKATFVGHPLFDHLPHRTARYPDPPDNGAWRIALLPGSRVKEIHRHAPAQVIAAERIRREFPKAEFVFAAADARCAGLVREAAGDGLPIVTGHIADTLADAHFALATSGTVTLETAYLGLPMVVFYHVSKWSQSVLRWLMRIDHYSLVNILAGREMVPELMPWHGDPAVLADAVLAQLRRPDQLPAISAALVDLAETLHGPGGRSASDAAADLVLQTMRD